MRKTALRSYEASDFASCELTAERSFAGSIDDLPIMDWNTADPFKFDDDDTF